MGSPTTSGTLAPVGAPMSRPHDVLTNDGGGTGTVPGSLVPELPPAPIGSVGAGRPTFSGGVGSARGAGVVEDGDAARRHGDGAPGDRRRVELSPADVDRAKRGRRDAVGDLTVRPDGEDLGRAEARDLEARAVDDDVAQIGV